jgi:hypothetical protein
MKAYTTHMDSRWWVWAAIFILVVDALGDIARQWRTEHWAMALAFNTSSVFVCAMFIRCVRFTYLANRIGFKSIRQAKDGQMYLDMNRAATWRFKNAEFRTAFTEDGQ